MFLVHGGLPALEYAGDPDRILRDVVNDLVMSADDITIDNDAVAHQWIDVVVDQGLHLPDHRRLKKALGIGPELVYDLYRGSYRYFFLVIKSDRF